MNFMNIMGSPYSDQHRSAVNYQIGAIQTHTHTDIHTLFLAAVKKSKYLLTPLHA